MKKMRCAEARQIDLVKYLASLGYEPTKVKNKDYWYLSPLRKEETPSFKVNRHRNIWYDHGIGKGGDLIGFGIQYFNCTISELLLRLSLHQHIIPNSSPLVGTSRSYQKKDEHQGKIVIQDIRPLTNKSLLNYLKRRSIPLGIAKKFCKEIDFLLYGNKQTVIGFQNKSGGFELRNDCFKGSSSPKDITFIDNNSEVIAVFEGFFDFLSFCVMNKNNTAIPINYLILNSLSFLPKSQPLMEKHQHIILYLDQDPAGINYTHQLAEDNPRYKDGSLFYAGQKDLNQWLVQNPSKSYKETTPPNQTVPAKHCQINSSRKGPQI